jgi:predicted amidohydrolase
MPFVTDALPSLAPARDEWTVGVVQLESQDDLRQNLERVSDLVGRARRLGAEIAVLPENFAFMGPEEERRALAEPVEAGGARPEDGPIVRALREIARREGVHLVAGGMPERSGDPDRPFNTSVALGPDGSVLAVYRKIHLFDVDVGDGHAYRESKSTSAGGRAVTVELGGLVTGLSVCYDVRFGALYRALVDRGAEALTVPAAFTLMTGKDHWHVLLRARAIECQSWVFAAAQSGSHPKGRRTFGKSCIVDPWGDVVAQASDGPGVAVARVDRGRVASVRGSLPSLRHRREFE